MVTGQSFNTPVKKYINCLTRSSERLHTQNTILEREKNELKSIVTARKRRLSGKRQVIDGKHLLTMVEILNSVKDAEQVTREWKKRQLHKSGRRGSKAQKELMDESESELEVANDDTVEIMDCIEVQS